MMISIKLRIKFYIFFYKLKHYTHKTLRNQTYSYSTLQNVHTFTKISHKHNQTRVIQKIEKFTHIYLKFIRIFKKIEQDASK